MQNLQDYLHFPAATLTNELTSDFVGSLRVEMCTCHLNLVFMCIIIYIVVNFRFWPVSVGPFQIPNIKIYGNSVIVVINSHIYLYRCLSCFVFSQ